MRSAYTSQSICYVCSLMTPMLAILQDAQVILKAFLALNFTSRMTGFNFFSWLTAFKSTISPSLQLPNTITSACWQRMCGQKSASSVLFMLTSDIIHTTLMNQWNTPRYMIYLGHRKNRCRATSNTSVAFLSGKDGRGQKQNTFLPVMRSLFGLLMQIFKNKQFYKFMKHW